MRSSLREIKRQTKIKAVIFGFLAFFILQWVIALIVGGGWGWYSTTHIVVPYLNHCEPHCDAIAGEKYMNLAIAPYFPFLRAAAVAFVLISMFILPFVGGLITGRRAIGAEIINSGVLGTLLIVYTILVSDALYAFEITAPREQSAFSPGALGENFFTFAFSVWGGALARAKNSNETISSNERD